MRKFFLYGTLFAFVLYWGVTFLFVAPKNYITTSLFKDNNKFHYFFNQNWELFVTLPTYNKKLYYTFYNKKDTTEIYQYEVLSKLLKLKSEKAPFNSSEVVKDYILSNSLRNISWWAENYEDYIVEEQTSTSNGLERNMECKDEQLIRKKRKFIQNMYYFQLLKRYSLFVAKKNNIPIHEYYISFSIGRVNFPKFADREKLNNNEFVFEENILFKSKKFSINP